MHVYVFARMYTLSWWYVCASVYFILMFCIADQVDSMCADMTDQHSHTEFISKCWMPANHSQLMPHYWCKYSTHSCRACGYTFQGQVHALTKGDASKMGQRYWCSWCVHSPPMREYDVHVEKEYPDTPLPALKIVMQVYTSITRIEESELAQSDDDGNLWVVWCVCVHPCRKRMSTFVE